MLEPVVNEPKVVSEPKVWSDTPIIEEYKSDSEDEHVSQPTKEQEIPSFAFIYTDKHVKNPRQTVIEQNTCSLSPKPNKKDCSGLMSKKLGLGFRQAVPINATRKVNTVNPIVNNARPKAGFHKSVSPFRKSFNRTTTLRPNFSKQKVNTAEVNAVSAVKGKRETAVKPSAGCNWRPKRQFWHKDYPHRALQNKGIVDSGCSRHMTRNKAYLAEYQDFNGGPVAFGGSKGYITEAEYVAAVNCCGQVLWIQNQMLDYGFNFMNTKIYIDNESTICIVKNPVFHSKTKHIAIRHHFIRDAYEKKLIQVLKIHTDDNVADLLTKAFDVSRFQLLVVTIRMINP
ncbi:hypothetical protein Tco_1353824 [Tanacetum coccineum]